MPWKFLTIVLLLICLGFIFYIWNPGELIRQPKKIEPKIWDEVWVPFDFSSEGRQYVEAHLDTVRLELEKLSGTLTRDSITEIQKFFGTRGYITTHEGNRVVGGKIAEYLKGEMGTIDNIDLELKGFYAEEYTDILNLPFDEQSKWDILHHVKLDIKVVYTRNGKLIDPEGGRGDRHIRDCDWIG